MAKQPRKNESEDVGLSNKEYAIFALFFFFIPAANVLVSSTLYYVWKREQPRKAKQINSLGFIILGLQIAMYILFSMVLAGVFRGGEQRTPDDLEPNSAEFNILLQQK